MRGSTHRPAADARPRDGGALGKALRPDHFSVGVWAPTGPLRLLVATCVVCGHRNPSWAAFRAHRADCRVRWAAGPPPPEDTDDVVLVGVGMAEDDET